MDITVGEVHAVEILDSRSKPTLAVTVVTAEGTRFSAGVPAGASTGSREAVELRDGDSSRFGGHGVRAAVAVVNVEVSEALRGRSFQSLQELDETLIALDGTKDKSRLGANAIVGVSMAAARAFAASRGLPLWRSLVGSVGQPRLPVPHFNVINGGVHAHNPLDFQEFMLAPLGAPNIIDAVRAGSEIYSTLGTLLVQRGYSVGLGDEGGFAPEISVPEDALILLTEAIELSGYRTGLDGVAIALDVASSELYHNDLYHLGGETLSSEEMIERYSQLVERFPIWLIEDGLAESDWDGWDRLTQQLGGRVELVGDDIFCTNPKIIADAVSRGIANSALIKVNQIGTVSETLEAMRLCRDAGYAQFVSHRSGETDDPFIADLAVGTGCGHIKAGAPARGERVAKYNRLMQIERDDGQLPYGLSPR